MRVTLDINVLVSGLITKDGYPGRLLSAVKRGDITLVTSEHQTTELRDVLLRDHAAVLANERVVSLQQ